MIITTVKKILFGVILTSSVVSYAQVGINTDTPRTTLHIDHKNPRNPDSSTGILVPRVTRNPTRGNENGQLIYNTTNNTFYFWNGRTWLPISSQTTNNANLNSKFADSRQSTVLSMTNSSVETLVPGASIEFTLDGTKPVQFYSTVNFAGTSSAFSPLFKLKLTNLSKSSNNVEIIDQASNTFLSDGISKYYGNLSLMTIKSLAAGRYKVEVVAFFNNCCNYDFNYNVGGADTPVSILIQYP